MQNFFLQLQGTGIQTSINEEITNIVEKITPEIPHNTFITDMAIIMILAAIVTLAFFKIKQPLIIGYLFAGMLIGPLSPLWTSLLPADPFASGAGTLGILSDVSVLNVFAEIGIILLLFVIGIEFPYSKIRAIGRTAIGIGTLGLFLTLGLVFFASSMLGLKFMDSLFLSAAI